jgi:hypothetical protein
MIFFEFSFRIKVREEDVFLVIQDFYPMRTILFYPHAQYYNEEKKCPAGACCFVYEFFYSNAGFETFFKGEIYNEEGIDEFQLALSFVKRFETEIVIGDFTCRSEFLLIKPDGKIYRAGPIGIGNAQYNSDVFEIDYDSLSPAVDLEDASRPQ